MERMEKPARGSFQDLLPEPVNYSLEEVFLRLELARLA